MLYAGTGSRSLIVEHPDYCKAIFVETKRLLIEGGATAVMSGMAEGFDECLAKAAVALNLPLHAVVPNYGYGRYYWGNNSLLRRDRYSLFESYLAYAADNGSIEYVIEDVYNTTGIYANGTHSNFLRNNRMVERVAAEIPPGKFLYYDDQSRGTKHCLRSIARTDLETIEVSVDREALPTG